MKNSGVQVGFTVFVLLCAGTLGYSLIEGWTIGESLYMTVITITTTGYQEVKPLTGEGRVFTVFLLTAGVCTLAYATNVLIIEWVSADKNVLRRKRMLKKIKKLKGHTIICGFGRMGKIVCKELWDSGVSFVVIDKISDNFKNVPDHYLWIEGDATDDELLMSVGIQEAKSLASMVDSDADSLYLTLAARSLNPNIDITARFSHESAAVKLKRAGANQVIQPLLLSGQKVAEIVMKKKCSQTFLNRKAIDSFPSLEWCEWDMGASPHLWGQTLEQFEKQENLIVACSMKACGEIQPRPDSREKIQKDHKFMVILQQKESDQAIAA